MPSADAFSAEPMTADPFDADRPGGDRPDTVRFAPPDAARVPAVVSPPTAAQSLAKIEHRLGELVRLTRLALGLGAAWLLWTVFGGGIAWLASAAAYATAIAVAALVLVGVAAYLSPRVRRGLGRSVRRAAGAVAGREG